MAKKTTTTPKQATTLRELARVRADNREKLNAIVGNQGTALGRKNYDGQGGPTGAPCIIVYIPHKMHRKLLSKRMRIPRKLRSADGTLEARTDVVVTTRPVTAKDIPPLDEANQELVTKLQWFDGTLDHIPVGAQVGFGDWDEDEIEGYVGTIGYVVRSTRKGEEGMVGVLTNQHVGVRSGHSLYIPGYDQQSIRVGLTRRVMEYMPDDQWLEGIDEAYAFVHTDAAFVEVEESLHELLRNEWPVPEGSFGAPLPIELDTMDVIGLKVKKVGRTTGLQRGTVVAFGYGVTGDSEHIDRAVGREPANFYTDLVIAPEQKGKSFSASGDSGSAILTDDGENRPVGLLWGGWPEDIGRGRGVEDVTFAIGVSRVLKAMELELL